MTPNSVRGDKQKTVGSESRKGKFSPSRKTDVTESVGRERCFLSVKPRKVSTVRKETVTKKLLEPPTGESPVSISLHSTGVHLYVTL